MSAYENKFSHGKFCSRIQIDGENDKILISCEEDFRLYIEQGQGKKIFFNNSKPVPPPEEEDDEMDAEDTNERQKVDRKSRKR